MGGEVFVDGKLVGQTPTNIALRGGEHEITIKVDGRVESRTIRVGVGDPIRYALRASDGSWIEGK